MRRVRRCTFILAFASLVLAPSTRSQDMVEASPQAVTQAAYPDTADGLRHLLQDVLAAAKSGDKQKVAAFVEDMEIPNYQAWFYKTYPDGAESWIGPYGANLEKNERSMQQLFAKLAQENEGELFTRSVNEFPEPGKGLEWGMLQAQKQPVDIYFASWKKPDAAKDSRGEPIGYFMFIDGKFRWDSLVTFGFGRLQVSNSSSLSSGSSNPPKPSRAGQSAASDQYPGVYRVGGDVSAPKPTYAPDPQYSEQARAAHYEGNVVLWLVVNAGGLPQDIKVQKSLGMGLDIEAIKAVRQWRFQPAMKDGKPVPVMINVQVSFRLK